MRYRLVFQSLAQKDIDDAYNWYEDELTGLGGRFLDELTHYYEKLKDHPYAFSETLRKYRKVSLHRFPYIVVFKITNDTVVVYAVFHTSRNPRHILKRK